MTIRWLNKNYFCSMKWPSAQIVYSRLVLFIFISAGMYITGCYKEQYTTASDVKLRFSKDTLRFDTVFTSVGSATRSFKIFNDASLPIKISSIKIKSSSGSIFRMNIDGFTVKALELNEIEIGAKDSIYAFIEVTVNPNQPLSVSPFVVTDQIDFVTNGNKQHVTLEAWGQNANYIPNRYANGSLALLSCQLQEETWSDPKPYVIYGVLFIDSCTLRIPAGARIYVHGGLARSNGSRYNDGIIYVLQNGRLLIEGTAEKKVLISGDRLEKELKDEWGSWAGIRIGPGSLANRISYAEIKSAIVGIYADSASDITIKNSIIYNTAGAGILGVHARVQVENCLIHSNGTHCIQFAFGGGYRVDYCTLANFENEAEALSLNNFIVRDEERKIVSVFPLNASITNTIMTGNGKDEITLIDANRSDSTYFKTSFINCYIKAEDLLKEKEYPNFFSKNSSSIRANNKDTIFLNTTKFDFRLDTHAVVNNKARFIDRVQIDLLNVKRDLKNPDIGCYELK